MLDKFFGRGLKMQSRESLQYLFKGFTFLGLRPPKKYRPLYFMYTCISMFCQFAVMPLAFNLSYFYEMKQMSPSQLLTSLQVAINACGLPAKILTLIVYLKHLRKAEDLMDILDKRCETPKDFEKLQHCIQMGNRLVVFFCLTYFTYSTSTFVCAVVLGQPPYSLYLPFLDWRKSTLQFCIQAVIEFILMDLTCLHQVMDDVYPVVYIYVVRTHLQLLVERVKRLGTNPTATKEDNYQELIKCILDHKHILDLLDVISPVISVTLFVQFLITAAILGTTMINIFIFADTSSQIAAVVYFLAVLWQTSPCCYQATCLMEDSDALALAIFQSNWIEEDKRFRKMLIFFTQRSQKCMTLTAMKLFPINVKTNLSIAKFSFSLYTLIKEMDFGQSLKTSIESES